MSKNLDILMRFMRHLTEAGMPDEAISAWAYNYAFLLCRADEELRLLPLTELPPLIQTKIMEDAVDLFKLAKEQFRQPQIATTEAEALLDHLSGEQVVGKANTLYQLSSVIAQLKSEIHETTIEEKSAHNNTGE